MTRHFKRYTLLNGCVLVLLHFAIYGQDIRRGRNEGTFNIPASNVMGNGNITIFGDLNGSYGSEGFGSNPNGGLAVGIGNILQFSGQLSLSNFKSLGTARADAQLTTPRNNRLRFFGIAVHTSLFLSTSIDTLSNSAAAGKPEFHAYIKPSLLLDLDWLALNNKLPLKMYLWFGSYDNPDLLFKYQQLAVKYGLEWKKISNSLFLDVGLGLYKENSTNVIAGDNGFEQQTLWIEPGARYRIFNKISILGALRILIVQKVKASNGLSPNYVKLSLGAEIPLIYKETNTEAIRTMMFIEKEKSIKKDIVTRSIEEGKKVMTDFESNFNDLDEMSTSNTDEQEAIKRREEIRKKMDEIESILEALDD